MSLGSGIGIVTFPWFSGSSVSALLSLRLRKQSHPLVFTDFRRETPSTSLTRDPEASQTFRGHTCSTHPWQNSKGAFSQSCNALDWVPTASFALPGSGTSLTCRAGLAFCTCSLAVCQGVHYYQECTRKLAAQCG